MALAMLKTLWKIYITGQCSMIIKTSELKELDFPWCGDVIENNIVDTSRWSIHHEIIFKWKDGKHYRAYYSVGATEMQEEAPWEYDDEVHCTEVELKEVTVKTWVEKE